MINSSGVNTPFSRNAEDVNCGYAHSLARRKEPNTDDDITNNNSTPVVVVVAT